MTTQREREIWAAEARGRESAKAECAERIRQAGLTTSFNMNVIVTTRESNTTQALIVESQLTRILANAVKEGMIVRYQLSVMQVIPGAN